MVVYRVTPPMRGVRLRYGIEIGHVKIRINALAIAAFAIVIVVQAVQVTMRFDGRLIGLNRRLVLRSKLLLCRRGLWNRGSLLLVPIEVILPCTTCGRGPRWNECGRFWAVIPIPNARLSPLLSSVFSQDLSLAR